MSAKIKNIIKFKNVIDLCKKLSYNKISALRTIYQFKTLNLI